MRKGNFKDLKAGEPVVLEYVQRQGKKVAQVNVACCDCGLVHNVSIVPLKSRLKMYFWRDNRRTANHRRAKL